MTKVTNKEFFTQALSGVFYKRENDGLLDLLKEHGYLKETEDNSLVATRNFTVKFLNNNNEEVGPEVEFRINKTV